MDGRRTTLHVMHTEQSDSPAGNRTPFSRFPSYILVTVLTELFPLFFIFTTNIFHLSLHPCMLRVQ